MEAWGIIMTAFTLFGMLVLVIASVTTDNGMTSTATMQSSPRADAVVPELKEAA